MRWQYQSDFLTDISLFFFTNRPSLFILIYSMLPTLPFYYYIIQSLKILPLYFFSYHGVILLMRSRDFNSVIDITSFAYYLKTGGLIFNHVFPVTSTGRDVRRKGLRRNNSSLRSSERADTVACVFSPKRCKVEQWQKPCWR